MANFSTEFPIDTKNSVEDVVRLACKWVTGSPHTRIPSTAFDELPLDLEQRYSNGPEEVTTAIAKNADYDIGGLRHVRTENGLEWVTSIVSLKTPERHMLSLQVSCEALSTAVRLPPPKKPYFIRQALTELGGGMDGEIPVTDKPFRLGEDEAGIAAALMMGVANNKLPIVYVSAGFDGTHLINPDELAKFVSGMAHVVVEPSRIFSFKVKTLTNSGNVFGGTIGVYWPESNARNAYFIDDETPNPRAIQIEIAKDIRLALSNRRTRTNCTWAHLKESISRKRYDLLKSQGSTALQEYIEAFDADQAAKDVKLADAEQEISRLNAELRRVTSSSQSSNRGLVNAGKEQDLYEHEIADIIVEALREALRAARENSRRHHVLTDLLAANKSSDTRQKLEEEIKSLFKTYRDMDARTRSTLARMGFELSEDGKHYKAVFQGDGRYTFTLPKTSSDHRAGRNTASDINNVLF
ncbi:MAG: hypothetical protein JNL37_09490 [Thauera sp.]|nr:hypothetical protein [Thauera sp.]